MVENLAEEGSGTFTKVGRGFNDRSRDDMKVIHAENSLDLGEESRQEA